MQATWSGIIKGRVYMATLARKIAGSGPVVEADYESAFAAFDYTCRHYLKMPAADFLKLWESGAISAKDAESSTGLSRVLDMLSLLRS